MTTYTCEICDHTKTQKSHITSHLKTKTHQKSAKIFRLELEKLSENELLKKYGDSDIDAIIKKLECVVSKPKIVEKKVPINEIIWRTSEVDEVANKQHEDIKAETFRVIKKCHDILYSSSAIVGVKAQNDIMKLLSLKLLEPQFKDESSDLYKRCIELKEELDEEDYENYMYWCQDINNITKVDAILIKWKNLTNKFLNELLPDIFVKSDATFNCTKDRQIIKVITELSKLTINQEFFDAFGSTCGDVHEMFRAYGKSSKELGQFFTPRKLINVIFHGIKDMINPKGTVYDPCMGTAGFLTRIQKLMNIDSEKIYGCEMEPDTAKYGQTSIYLNSGKLCPNIKVCNSLSENEYIITEEFDTIVTNPPFGTDMKYKDLEESYTQMFSEDYEFTFKDAYPININKGPPLFLQHCVNNIKKGGVCAIVLPAGELFEGSSKSMIEMRKWLCENADIQSIMKVPGGAFEHTGVKTNVLIFKKNGKTKEVKFLETNDGCTEVKEITTVSYKNIKAGNYNLGVDTYLEKPEAEAYDIPMVELGEIFEIKYGDKNPQTTVEGERFPCLGGGANVSKYTDTWNTSENTIIISRSGTCGHVSKFNEKSLVGSYAFILIPNNPHNNIEYIYYYLKSNQSDIENLKAGATVSNINRDLLSRFQIPLPPIEVQRQIVEELETLDESIKINNIKIEQIKKEMILYKKHGYSAEIKRALSGCEVKELGEICDMQSGKFNSKDCQESGKYPFFTNKANNPGGYSDTYCYDYPNYLIIIKDGGAGHGKYGDHIGLGKVFKVSGKSAGTSHQYALIPKIDINIDYLYYSIFTIKNNIMDMAKYTTGLGCIKKEQISQLQIPLPPIEVQRQIVELFKQKERELKRFDERIEDVKNDTKRIKEFSKLVIINN